MSSSESDQRTEQFLSLYNLEQQRIYALIRSLLFNRVEAEDVFQETCLGLWKNFSDFEPGTNFAAWAAQIARNRVLAHCKKRAADHCQFGDGALALICEEAIAHADVLDARRIALETCLNKLPQRDRDLLRRRYEPAVTTVKLAAELARPLNTLYKSLQKIRRQLLECIDRALPSEGAGP